MTSKKQHCVIESDAKNLVVVRYFLDRRGYDIHNSSSRLWNNPPVPYSTAFDIATFLDRQGIKKKDDSKMLVELFLDKFGSFMLLEACAEHSVKFDFTGATPENPGILNIRLTDLDDALAGLDKADATAASSHSNQQRCNTSPVGLFAFSMTVALDTLNVLRTLLGEYDGSVDDSFVLVWGPYAFFVSGLLQLLVGWNEIHRNNVYGATAFMSFGCFWLANGTKLILTSYFPEEIPENLLGSDAVGNFVREFYIMMFACALFIQTLSMNKLTTALISILIVYLLAASLTGWNVVFEWIKMILGWIVSLFAFYLFVAELTNEVYQREVFNMLPWNIYSPVEFFGAPGRVNNLKVKAIDLRRATSRQLLDSPNKTSAFDVRSVRPLTNEKQH